MSHYGADLPHWPVLLEKQYLPAARQFQGLNKKKAFSQEVRLLACS